MGPPLPTLFPGRRGMGEEHRLWERQRWWTARERGGWTGGEGGEGWRGRRGASARVPEHAGKDFVGQLKSQLCYLLPWDLGHVTEFLNAPVSCSVKWGHNSAWPLESLWGFQYSYLSP